MSIIQVNSFGEDNGLVYNAKGDLIGGSRTLNDVAVGFTIGASVTFNTDGTVDWLTSNGNGSYNNWVTTGTGWQGASNYSMSWTVFKTQTGGTFNPNGAGSGGFPKTFTVTATAFGGLASGTYTITITNNAAGTQTPETVVWTLNLSSAT